MSSIVDSFFGLNSANFKGNEEKIKIAFENLRAAAEGGYKNFVEAVRLSLGSETTFIDENGIITDYDTNIAKFKILIKKRTLWFFAYGEGGVMGLTGSLWLLDVNYYI